MRRRVKAIVAAAAVASVLLGACTFTFSAKPAPGPSPSPAAPGVTVQTMATDIQNFWKTEFPAIYGKPYSPLPLNRIFPAGEPGKTVSIPTCQGFTMTEKVWGGNAFYCFKDNFIVYDARTGGLIAELQKDFGTLAIGAVFAHEWGHAIQDRADESREPSIYKELQADCFSGSWVAHVKQTQPAGVAPDGVSETNLDSILTALLTLRDAPGSRAAAATAHGSGFDRVSAFQDGYENGAKACSTYFDKPPIITELPFTSEQQLQSGGNLPAPKVLPVTVDLLNNFYSKVERKIYEYVPLKHVLSWTPNDASTGPIKCGGQVIPDDVLTNDVVFCSDGHYFILDTDYLQRAYDDIGDFGVTTLVARPWAEYVETLKQIPGAGTGDPASLLEADCFTGGFTAAMANGDLSSPTLGGGVQISPGDLDEAIQAFILAQKVHPNAVDPFTRVEAFRQGFLKGYVSCNSVAAAGGASPGASPSA